MFAMNKTTREFLNKKTKLYKLILQNESKSKLDATVRHQFFRRF